jgi:hypothetical protein
MWIFQLSPWKTLGDAGRFDADLVAHRFTPQGDELAVASRTGVTFLDTDRWAPQRKFSAPLDRNARLLFTPNGRAFWLARDARTAALHDTHTFETLLPLPSGMTPLALSSDGQRVAVTVDAQRLQLLDLMVLHEQFRELGLDWTVNQ